MMNPKLAMAYNMKKVAHKASGGQMCAHGGPAMCAMGCYAEGGDVEEPGPHKDMMKHPMHSSKGIVDRMMAKKMAKGGMVENDEEDMLPSHEKALHYAYDDMEDPLYAEGGMVGGEDEVEAKPTTMIEHIMDRMKKKGTMRLGSSSYRVG